MMHAHPELAPIWHTSSRPMVGREEEGMARSSRQRFGRLAIALVGMLVVSACSSINGGGASTPGSGNTLSPTNSAKFVVGGVQPNAGNWPVQIGVDQGVFKKWGLDVD